jgi:predicted hydrocarbon binding protein/DNA-binding HxlR family transcriptional regulator
MKKSAFDVYSTSTGLKQISNPVRQKILCELQSKDLSLTEIANLTAKAQSTLSVHLDKMVKEGLVASRDDPNDNRRKIFYLTSRPVGSSIPPREELKIAVGECIVNSVGTPSSFLKGLIRAIIIGVESMGFNMDPAIHDIGFEIGKALAKDMGSTNIEDLISEVQEFYELHDLGEVCVYSFLPLTIIIRDDYDCSDTPEAGRTICLLNEGVVQSILETKTGKAFRVSNDECFGIGNNYCKFVIEPVMSD